MWDMNMSTPTLTAYWLQGRVSCPRVQTLRSALILVGGGFGCWLLGIEQGLDVTFHRAFDMTYGLR